MYYCDADVNGHILNDNEVEIMHRNPQKRQAPSGCAVEVRA